MMSEDQGKREKLEFQETDLRLGLGLPGGDNNDNDNISSDVCGKIAVTNGNGKREFTQTQSVDLKLNLSSSNGTQMADPTGQGNMAATMQKMHQTFKPPAKAQVVGWPPVRSYRKNVLANQKSSSDESDKAASGGGAAFVKVSMDGAPYLRKVDLKIYKSYQELSDALAKMFSSFTIGKCNTQGMMDFVNESKLMDLLNGSEYVPTYEDQDGDWMLVGDVPWEMFVESCKRLRIMKGTEAIGLAPRAMEKCKRRS